MVSAENYKLKDFIAGSWIFISRWKQNWAPWNLTINFFYFARKLLQFLVYFVNLCWFIVFENYKIILLK